MSFLTKSLHKVSAGAAALDLADGQKLLPKHGLLAEVVDTGIGMGASYLLGQAHGRYREDADFRGVPLNLMVGTVGKGLAIVLDAFAGGAKGVAHHLNTVANAGLYSYAFTHGVSSGTEASGRSVLLFGKGANVPTLPGATRTTVVGEIPPAPRGTFLHPEEMAHFAQRTK